MLWVVALGLVSRSYGYDALVPSMASNLNRRQNLPAELAMSDFEGAGRAAQGLAGNRRRSMTWHTSW
jgi:hypothetical protein